MRLVSWWNKFFFDPQPPQDLAICRILFCAGMLVHLCTERFWRWAGVAHAFYRPIWLFKTLRLSIVSERWVMVMQLAAITLLILAMLGIFTRIALTLSGMLLLYLLALPSNFGKVGHGDAILVLTTFILAISRCDEAFALEHRLRRRDQSIQRKPSGEYRWPIQLVCVLMALVFFGAGVTKLRRSGLAWVTSDSFAVILVQHHHQQYAPPTTWGLTIAQHPTLSRGIAGATVLGEILFPLALFSRRARKILLPFAILAQVFIGLVLGVWFIQFLFCYLFWVPWSRLWRSTGAFARQSPLPTPAQINL